MINFRKDLFDAHRLPLRIKGVTLVNKGSGLKASDLVTSMPTPIPDLYPMWSQEFGVSVSAWNNKGFEVEKFDIDKYLEELGVK